MRCTMSWFVILIFTVDPQYVLHDYDYHAQHMQYLCNNSGHVMYV